MSLVFPYCCGSRTHTQMFILTQKPIAQSFHKSSNRSMFRFVSSCTITQKMTAAEGMHIYLAGTFPLKGRFEYIQYAAWPFSFPLHVYCSGYLRLLSLQCFLYRNAPLPLPSLDLIFPTSHCVCALLVCHKIHWRGVAYCVSCICFGFWLLYIAKLFCQGIVFTLVKSKSSDIFQSVTFFLVVYKINVCHPLNNKTCMTCKTSLPSLICL